MPEVHVDRVRTYDVDDDVEIPPVTALLAGLAHPPPAVDGGVDEQPLEATYLDTADLRLAAAGLTLRRGTGGVDAGWHLEVPSADGGRLDVREPIDEDSDGPDEVPGTLRRMVRAVARGGDLVPVARTSTTRTERRVVSTTGRVLAELTDDRVSAERLPVVTTGGGPAASGWRQVEVALVHGDDELLAALDTGLRGRGLRPSPSVSGLARVLDARPSEVPGVRLHERTTAGVVVLAHVTAQVAQLRGQDLPVRLDADDSVHRMRVATRRLRSALSTFGPLFPAAASALLREELRWLAAGLGGARDAEVLRDRVARWVASERDAAVDGAPGGTDDAALDAAAQLGTAYRDAHDRVLELLDSERYHRLLGDLDAFVADPPTRGTASGRASRVLPRLVRSRYRRLQRLVRAATQAPPGEDRDTMLHEARKAAKRARYAAEAVQQAFGADAGRFAAAMEAVQEVLGEHQDSVVTRARLRDLAAATSSPAAAFVYGRLDAQEEARGEAAERRLDAVWSQARRGRLRRWLR